MKNVSSFIYMIAISCDTEMFFAYRGLRIAKMVIKQYYDAVLTVVPKLSKTDREEDGFGSTQGKDKC